MTSTETLLLIFLNYEILINQNKWKPLIQTRAIVT